MTHLIGRRELIAAGIGACASLGAGAAFAQQTSQVAPRESGTDALGRRVGNTGVVANTSKSSPHYAWCVRGGSGVDIQ